jgi:FdhD protein
MMNSAKRHVAIGREAIQVQNEVKQYVDGAQPYTYQVVEGDSVTSVQGGVIHEQLVTIYVNGEELATIMCSPLLLEELAVGFLFNESVIESYDEVGLVQRNVAGTVIDVFLTHNEFNPPRRMILTSGCGGGVTWQQLSDTYPALETDFKTSPDILLKRMHELKGAARLYNLVRGVHTAVLSSTSQLLVNAEDVGRHNAIDKIAGQALISKIPTTDCILLTSGRISSEMLGKARRMKIPIVASRTAPTSITVQLAQAWNICVVGYVRRGSMRVYTHPNRLGLLG